MRRPIGFSSGKYWCASVSSIRITGGASRPSRSESSLPRSSAIPIVFKYRGLMRRKSATSSCPAGRGRFSMVKYSRSFCCPSGSTSLRPADWMPGMLFHLVEHAPVKGGLLAIVLVEIVGGQAHAKRQDMIGPDARIHVLQIHEALHGESRADQQHAGQSDLPGHQQTPHPRPAARCGRGPAAGLQARRSRRRRRRAARESVRKSARPRWRSAARRAARGHPRRSPAARSRRRPPPSASVLGRTALRRSTPQTAKKHSQRASRQAQQQAFAENLR